MHIVAPIICTKSYWQGFDFIEVTFIRNKCVKGHLAICQMPLDTFVSVERYIYEIDPLPRVASVFSLGSSVP